MFHNPLPYMSNQHRVHTFTMMFLGESRTRPSGKNSNTELGRTLRLSEVRVR